jgi:WD40 repeat protein/serine/threonine protein kinase
MSNSLPNGAVSGKVDHIMAEVVAEITDRLHAGEPVDVEEYARRHPDLADRLRRLVSAMQVLDHFHSSAAPGGPASEGGEREMLSGTLGDFRLIREVGRGGMGVVYEAEQESLGRRVALKVLRRLPGQDARMLARFRRESRAAAQLHHSNIVPVFEVGQQGELCYYAMQFIRGQALDEVFRELRRLRSGGTPGAIQEAAVPPGPLAQALRTGSFEPASSACATMDFEPPPASAATMVVPQPAEPAAALPDSSELSSVTSDYQRYCRNVARLGLQAAEALAYAHGRGIIHRDIKPANLLLDNTGVLWVSDFGLVKTQDPALTDTGDLVGTLRYMAPERFRGECDARADVYALGLTLYELLVLRPALDGQDGIHLVEQIGRQEPPRLRTLESRIPRDLETIVMKAIEKDPRRRYASAEALAGDLRRFLADEPIQARRIGLLERLGRWGRRNPLVAGLSAAVVLLAVLGFVGLLGQWQMALAQEQEAKNHATQVEQERDKVQALNEQLKATQDQLRRTLYATQTNLARHAWEDDDISRVQELLDQQRPRPGERDLRGWEWHYLHHLCHSELLNLGGHTGRVTGLAYSPDGKRLASASTTWDRTKNAFVAGEVKIWDAQTGREVLTIPGHAATLIFSPDGQRLASGIGAWDDAKKAYLAGEVTVWDAVSGQVLLSHKGVFGGVAAFSPDGKRWASRVTSEGEEIKLYDVQTGKELLSLKGHTGWTEGVAFSPDGKRLATASTDGTVKVWDAQTGQELLSLKGTLWKVAFSPDGKRLAGGSWNTLKVWDAQTGQELLSRNESDGAYVKAFSPDGKLLATTSQAGTLRIWDVQTGQAIRAFKSVGGVTGDGQILTFSPDGQRLAGIVAWHTVKIWNAQNDQESRTLPAGSASTFLGFSPDWRRLASAASDDTVEIRDAQTGQRTLTLKGHTAPVMTVAFSPDGKQLASGGGGHRLPDGTWGLRRFPPFERAEIKVWDAQTGREAFSVPGLIGYVGILTFSPDGKHLVGASGGPIPPWVKVWDAQTGQELFSLQGPVAFSPDGKRLAGASGPPPRQAGASGPPPGQGPQGPRLIKIWDAQTRKELFSLEGGGMSLAFSPDGKRLASGSKVWDAQTGKELLSLKVTPAGPLVFSPDGMRLATTSGQMGGPGGQPRPEMEVQVWDAETGRELCSFKGPSGLARGLVFSPDGKRLVSGGNKGLKVWDAQTGQELLVLKSASRFVGFSPDGHRLAGITSDGTVKIYDATPGPAKP